MLVFAFTLAWAPLHGLVEMHFVRAWFLECMEKSPDRSVEVEVTSEGLHYVASRTRTIIDWSLIERIVETDTTAYFVYYQGGCFAVRKRAFSNSDDEDQFLNAAHHYVQAAKPTEPIAKETGATPVSDFKRTLDDEP